MTTKTTAQDKLIDFANANGWKLDTTVIINTFSGWGSFSKLEPEVQAKYLKQHPFMFRRAAADGGTWQVELDYRNKSDYGGRFGNRLHGAFVRYFDAEGKQKNLPVSSFQLKKPTIYSDQSHLYKVTGDADEAISKHVERLLAGPEVAVWLAVESEVLQRQQWRKEAEARAIERELRERPLPEGWGELASVAYEVAKADGMTNTADLIARLSAATVAVVANLAPQQVQ
jgi:hypothetical protein